MGLNHNYKVPCSTCKAKPGKPCVDGKYLTRAHKARRRLSSGHGRGRR